MIGNLTTQGTSAVKNVPAPSNRAPAGVVVQRTPVVLPRRRGMGTQMPRRRGIINSAIAAQQMKVMRAASGLKNLLGTGG